MIFEPRNILTVTLAAGLGMTATGVMADVDCIEMVEPVISLDHGSRYKDGSETRSDLDKGSNDAVNKALKPIDTFIGTLTQQANKIITDADEAEANADCVVDALHVWAEADALSKLETLSAYMSSPSRIGGLAFAYDQARNLSTQPDKIAVIDAWFETRTDEMIEFWNEEAPTKASRNNLRAWAAVAAARVGLTLGKDEFVRWASYSVSRVVCTANEDGSLPLEMGRAHLALHYQMHAVAPLVTAAALLEPEGYNLFEVCDAAIPRSVEFAVAAFADPSIVEAHAGEPQSYFTGKEELRSHEVAWAPAYLEHRDSEALREFIKQFESFGNSKLGGNQELFWELSG